jgi:hypothetical protein
LGSLSWPSKRRATFCPIGLEALPILAAAAAAVLYGASLGLSSTIGFVGLAIAAYGLVRGAWVWVVALGIVLNVPLAVIAVLILSPG